MRQSLAYALGLTIILSSGFRAAGVEFVTNPLVDHPIGHPIDGRSPYRWRSSVGAWGEQLVEEMLRLRGFDEIHEIKTGSNNGIDRIAIKRTGTGELLDVKFVEVKTSRSATPKLGATRSAGRQMSRPWLARHLKALRNSGNPDKQKLAVDISRFRKSMGSRPIESLGEVVHIDTRTGRMTGYSADGRSVKYSVSAERVLKDVQKRSVSRGTSSWATRALAQWDAIRTTKMSQWLGRSVSEQSTKTVLARSGRSATKAVATTVPSQAWRVLLGKALRRGAGPIAAVVAFGFDAKELIDAEYAFRRGAISVRQRNTQLVSTLGGMAGAWAGGYAGLTAGASLGTVGGPIAGLTVPAGGIIGAGIGAVGGYLVGSSAAQYGANAWYESIDESVKDRIEREWLEGSGAAP